MPSVERRKEIEDIVNDVINSNEELQLPGFDIVNFLSGQGFSIASKFMSDDTTGLLMIDDDNFIPETQTHKLVVINTLLQSQDDYLQRRRFIIAHEYAHSILHKHASKQFAHRDTSKKDSNEEKEADYFARCLLMPQNMLKTVLNIDLIKNLPYDKKVDIVSRLFNVTSKKADQRLRLDMKYEG